MHTICCLLWMGDSVGQRRFGKKWESGDKRLGRCEAVGKPL
jgi:hypothetical protein